MLLTAALMRVEGEHAVYVPGRTRPLPPSCLSQLIWGIPCPSCGMTRGMISMAHGAWSLAWQFNPASVVLYLFLLALIPWHLYQLWRIRKGQSPRGDLWNFTPIVAITAIMIGQWLLRMWALATS